MVTTQDAGGTGRMLGMCEQRSVAKGSRTGSLQAHVYETNRGTAIADDNEMLVL